MSEEKGKAEEIQIAREAARRLIESKPNVSPEGRSFLAQRAKEGKPLSAAALAVVGNAKREERAAEAVELYAFPKELAEYIKSNCEQSLEREVLTKVMREREKMSAKRSESGDSFSPFLHRFDLYGVPLLTNRGYLRVHGRGKWWIKEGFEIDVGEILNRSEIITGIDNEEQADRGEHELREADVHSANPEEMQSADARLMSGNDLAKLATDTISSIFSEMGNDWKLKTAGDISEKQMVENAVAHITAVMGEHGELTAKRLSKVEHMAVVGAFYGVRRVVPIAKGIAAALRKVKTRKVAEPVEAAEKTEIIETIEKTENVFEVGTIGGNE